MQKIELNLNKDRSKNDLWWCSKFANYGGKNPQKSGSFEGYGRIPATVRNQFYSIH